MKPFSLSAGLGNLIRTIVGILMTNKEQANALKVEKVDLEWWIVNHNPPIGPYNTYTEANEIRSSTRQFYLHHCPEDQMLDLLDDILS